MVAETILPIIQKYQTVTVDQPVRQEIEVSEDRGSKRLRVE